MPGICFTLQLSHERNIWCHAKDLSFEIYRVNASMGQYACKFKLRKKKTTFLDKDMKEIVNIV